MLLLRNLSMKSKKKILIGEVLELNLNLNRKVHINDQTVCRTFKINYKWKYYQWGGIMKCQKYAKRIETWAKYLATWRK